MKGGGEYNKARRKNLTMQYNQSQEKSPGYDEITYQMIVHIN